MSLQRYSAVHMFGAPIEGIEGRDGSQLVDLMAAYNIEPQEVPTEPTDITPYYWMNPNFRYFVSMAHPEGPAIVDLLPRHTDTEMYLLQRIGGKAVGLHLPDVRHIEIPTDEISLAIVGPSPRFPDKLNVHELINYTD